MSDTKSQSFLSILNLPTEILRKIFSFLVRVPPPNSKATLPCPQIFTIRSVCRKFRMVANELPFWCAGNVHFFDLIPKRLHQYYNTEEDWNSYEHHFLQLLYRDSHLVQCLERRSHWQFKSL